MYIGGQGEGFLFDGAKAAGKEKDEAEGTDSEAGRGRLPDVF